MKHQLVKRSSRALPLHLALPVDRPHRRTEAESHLPRAEELEAGVEHFFGASPRDGVLGIFVRRVPKPNGTRVRIFDYDHSVGLAMLIAAGFEPRMAAALIDMDVAVPVGPTGANGFSDDAAFELAVAATDSRGLAYAVLLREDAWELETREIPQWEGYHVVAMKEGKVVGGPPLLHALRMVCPRDLSGVTVASSLR